MSWKDIKGAFLTETIIDKMNLSKNL